MVDFVPGLVEGDAALPANHDTAAHADFPPYAPTPVAADHGPLLVEIVATLKRIINHLDPHGTSQTLRTPEKVSPPSYTGFGPPL